MARPFVREALPEDLGDLQDPAQFAQLVSRDASWKEALDRLAELARRILGVPLAQINVVLSDRQVSLSSVAEGPGRATWNGPRSVPLEASYCRHVVRSGEPLAVEDALAHPLVKDNPATTEAGIRSYAAIPLKNRAGESVATLCVVDFEARDWDSRDLESLAAVGDLLMREIRGRLRAESALQQGEARFRSLIEHGTDLITVLDRSGEIRYQSPAYEGALGYEAGSLEGTKFTSLLHPGGLDRWRESFLRPLREPGGRASEEWRMRHQDGSWRTVRGTGVNLLDDPAVRGLVLNIYDVTQERQLEAELHQAQKMEAVGRLAGGVAHDFNNLLTAIRGNTEFLLSDGELSPDAEVDVQEILETVKRASGLTRQLLAFSSDQVLELEVVDLGAVAERTTTLVKRLTGVNVKLETSFEQGLLVEADEGQLGQVIMNLAVNARDAMAEGGTLRLEAQEFTATQEYVLSHSEMEPGHYALLVVADDGEGMRPEVKRRIFEPFFTTKAPERGTGLGLSICWGIVKQMDGHIHVYSEAGRGTAFHIYLPRTARESTVPSRTVQAGAPDAFVAPADILVVEDQPEVRRVVTRALTAAGHSVWEAGSAEDALELVSKKASSVDLLLSDILLPGMNGSELACRLSRQWPDLKVLFTSGFTRGELKEQSIELQTAHFIPKPFGPDELSEAVRGVLGGRLPVEVE